MPSFHTDARRPSSRSAPTAPSHRTGAWRGIGLVLVSCLSLVTGLALLATGATLGDPRIDLPVAGAAAANADVVRDFYAAVDYAIRTGDVDDLDLIVAPDVAWCVSCPGQDHTRDGLKRHLAHLHRIAPEARLAVESVDAGTANSVTARVRLTGLPLMVDTATWGPVDTLRLAGGWIMERRPGPGGVTRVAQLVTASFGALPPAVTGIAMARLTFSLGAGMEGLLSAGPTLLIVESGTLAVRIARGGRILRADDGRAWATADEDAGLATVLRQGDAAVVPAGVRHALEQEGTTPAVAVGATLFFVDDGRGQRGPERAVFSPLDGPGLETTRLRPLPTVQLLAEGTVAAWPRGPVEIAIGRAVLDGDASLVPARGEAALLAVETGTLVALGDAERTLAAGEWAMQPAGVDREFRNPGDGFAVVLMLTIAAVAA